MSEVQHSYEDCVRAAKTLSAIALSELDVEISHQALMSLIKSKWGRIAPLAHIVHGAPDTSKFGSGEAPRVPDANGFALVGYRYRYTDVRVGSAVDNPWRFVEHRPSGLNNIEVQPVYSREV